MAGYKPLKIVGMSSGLIQDREEFLLPDDAYPTLQNAYVWRERILRKKGYELLGRLQRNLTGQTVTLTDGSVNIITALSLGSLASIAPGTISLTGSVDGTVYTDPLENGTLTATDGTGTGGTINYATGLITITEGGAETLTGAIGYYPGLPVMGIRTRELQDSAIDQTVFFDQVYAYVFNSMTMEFQEFIPGTTWNASGASVTGTDFFWSTNYWVSDATNFTTINKKLFWVTNNTGADGATADPIRVTDGVTWLNFILPTYGQIDATPTYLVNCLSMLPFRGRLLAFNTWEGATKAGALNFSNRIRWSTIGNPFIPFSAGPPATGSWRDDIRGQGGFLDIPTSEDIVSVGFVRDNLVIYCERSTWQLRYTGRSIAPFQIERVNSELGGQGPFSAIQFDTSLVGIGDKGIVECDSYKSERIDIKIPDYVFDFTGPTTNNNSAFRVHGVRDFVNRLAYWTIPWAQDNAIFPTQRLVYNYENDSWATFNDSLTTLGTYQPQTSRNWINTKIPWTECKFSWINSRESETPQIVGGNQQGFIEYLDELTVNDYSLYISAITPHVTTPTVITSPNHNMKTGFVIEIGGIPTGTPYADLNGGVFGIVVVDVNSFKLFTYDTESMQFSSPQLNTNEGTYVGEGMIKIRENFNITSKKFNFLDEGQNIQLGYLDILMDSTELANPGAISLYVYQDYNDVEPTNILPQNRLNEYSVTAPDTFFNSIIPTTTGVYNTMKGTKFWQRVYCSTRSSFITLEYTFSNAQMAGPEQQLDVQIDAQVLWIRKAGRMTQP